MLRTLSIVLFGALVAPTFAMGAINLKKVNIVNGNQIDLLFDAKVEPGQVKTDFVRDNIQLSLANTSVYPAKVSMVSGSDLTKVFAYQYSPALVRARFTVKGDASEYANRLQVKISGKTISVRIADERSDQVAATAASALRVAAQEAKEAKDEKKAEPTKAESKAEAKAEQKALLARVSGDKKTEKSAGTEPLAGGKTLATPFRSIGVMLFVLGIFGLFVMFLKRLKNGGARSAKSMGGPLGGFLNKLSGSAGGRAMIEVVATHHLAPKRSIVVVRIQDRMLVLGMTNDAVNLITEFKAGEDGEAEENIGLGDFAASLKKFESAADTGPSLPKSSPAGASRANLGDIAAAALGLAKPTPSPASRVSAANSAYQTSQAKNITSTGPSLSPAFEAAMREPSVKPSIRAQIKDRVQGMKRL